MDVARNSNVALIRRIAQMKGVPSNHLHSKDGANALVECARNGCIEGASAPVCAPRGLAWLPLVSRRPELTWLFHYHLTGVKAIMIAGANVDAPNKKGEPPQRWGGASGVIDGNRVSP